VTWEQYATAWSELHGGFDPATASPLIRGWVRLAYRGGSLLGRLRVGPGAVTAAGLLLCIAVPVAAVLRPGGLLAGGVIVLLASVADGLDGAVAVVTGRVSRLGFVYDSVADRAGEAAWLAAFWVAGAPGWLVVAAGAVSWLHEYVRARAAAAGMAGIGTVTVGERPTRVAVATAGLVVAGAAGLVRDVWAAPVLTGAAAAWLALAVLGLAQLAVIVHRELSDGRRPPARS
jgi:CDP-diacylglycerol--glycerol-3-phosphate 3-phosphatidyltransferase